jgi:F-type H+-transporting ATPase subunit epsilon
VAQADSLSLRLELVSPTGPVYEGDVSMVVLPAVTGEMGIMARHAPLVTQLSTGVLRVMTVDGQWVVFAVSEGFAKVQFDKVIVLADFAAAADDIDVGEAQGALAAA